CSRGRAGHPRDSPAPGRGDLLGGLLPNPSRSRGQTVLDGPAGGLDPAGAGDRMVEDAGKKPLALGACGRCAAGARVVSPGRVRGRWYQPGARGKGLEGPSERGAAATNPVQPGDGG